MSAIGLSFPMPAIPGLSGFPSLTGGTAGPANGTANNGLSMPLSTPTNIDGSGWVVNFGNGNTTRASGNSGANDTHQTATPTASSMGSAGNMPTAQGYMLPIAGQLYQGAQDSGGPMPPMGPNTTALVLGAVGVFLLLTRR